MLFWRKTPPIIGAENSVSELRKIKIGGIDQWLLIRGKNKNNPVLLFLHGGPGSAQIAVARNYQSFLEEYFIVVNWDQRGAGLSYSPNVPKEQMRVNSFIRDTKELIDYLTKTYGKEKIYIRQRKDILSGAFLGEHIGYIGFLQISRIDSGICRSGASS